mgnify:CR=1 FL=1
MKNPKIRFKGCTEDWEQRKLSELITEYKEIVDSDCTLPVLTSSKTEGVVLQEDHFGRKQLHDITGYNILPRNYCTYRNRSDGVDFTFNINKCCDKGIISKFYPVFYGNNSNIFFISLVLNYSDEVVKEIAYTCTGTGQKVLSFLDLQKMNLRVPSEVEQNKIAAYFDSLDTLITLHQRKCEGTKKLKKYMLQKMFPKDGATVPEIRFTGFTEDWEQRKVSDVAEIIAGGTPSTKENSYWEPKEIPWLSSGEVHKKYITFTDDMISQIGMNNSSAKMVAKDSVLIALAGQGKTRGTVAINRIPLTTNQSIAAMTFNEDFIPEFVFYNLENRYDELRRMSSGDGSRGGLNKQLVGDIEIPYTEKEEQERIGSFFESLDHLITLHQRKCDELQKIKKYMLQNMFV